MNQPSNLGRSLAGFGIVGLVVAGLIHLSTSNSQSVDRAIPQRDRSASDLPLVPPIASSELASVQVDVNQAQPAQLNSAQIALKDAQVAVSRSQAQLAQAQINLSEFQAQHDNAKRGNVSGQQAATATAAYELAQLQYRLAAIGLQESTAQLIAAKAEVRSLGRKANSGNQM